MFEVLGMLNSSLLLTVFEMPGNVGVRQILKAFFVKRLSSCRLGHHQGNWHLCDLTFFAKRKHTRRLMVGVFQGSSKWTDSGLNFPLLFLINSKRRQWLFIDGWFIIFCLLDSCAPACARSNHKQTTNSVVAWHCFLYAKRLASKNDSRTYPVSIVSEQFPIVSFQRGFFVFRLSCELREVW